MFIVTNSTIFTIEPINISIVTPIQLYEKPSIIGIVLGFIMTELKNVSAIQLSFIINRVAKIIGAHFGIINIAKDVIDLQWGLLNYT